MAKKYAVLAFVLVQSLGMAAMSTNDQSQAPLNRSTETLSRSGGLSQSQELSKKMKQVTASFYTATPCCPMAKLHDLKHDWKPLPADHYSDCP